MKFGVPEGSGQGPAKPAGLSGSTVDLGKPGRGHFGEAGRGGFEGQVWGVLGHLFSQAQTQIRRPGNDSRGWGTDTIFFHNYIPHQATLLFGVYFCIR